MITADTPVLLPKQPAAAIRLDARPMSSPEGGRRPPHEAVILTGSRRHVESGDDHACHAGLDVGTVTAVSIGVPNSTA